MTFQILASLKKEAPFLYERLASSQIDYFVERYFNKMKESFIKHHENHAWKNKRDIHYTIFENQVSAIIEKNAWLKEHGVKVSLEVLSGLSPFDMVLYWETESGPRSLIVEIDGSHHYYSSRDRIASQATEFKYRILDLYGLPYLRI